VPFPSLRGVYRVPLRAFVPSTGPSIAWFLLPENELSTALSRVL
jgi:hypothetical protein